MCGHLREKNERTRPESESQLCRCGNPEKPAVLSAVNVLPSFSLLKPRSLSPLLASLSQILPESTLQDPPRRSFKVMRFPDHAAFGAPSVVFAKRPVDQETRLSPDHVDREVSATNVGASPLSNAAATSADSLLASETRYTTGQRWPADRREAAVMPRGPSQRIPSPLKRNTVDRRRANKARQVQAKPLLFLRASIYFVPVVFVG
ncbi:hypothetical protein MRX96_028940 [Rhipicephalus microplus]